jgi:uncharacterized phage-like protein YoqJ
MKCFVTGHRQIDLEQASEYVKQLTDMAIAHGATQFYSGMALGVDQLAASEWTRRELPWTAVIPCRGYESRWENSQQKVFRELLDAAEENLWLHEKYTMGCNHVRNRWLVDTCEMGIAIFDGRRGGGTRYTVKRAIAQKRLVFWVDPKTGDQHQYVSPTQLTLF